MKKILSAIIALTLALCMIAAAAGAANTVKTGGSFVCITDIDSDWVWTSVLGGYPSGAATVSIQFIPGAADDRAVFLSGAAEQAVVFDTGPCLDEYDARIKYFDGNPVKIFFDYSESTISSGSGITINFDLPVSDQF